MVRADKQKNIDKVAAAKAKNPLATEREIVDETGLGAGTVHRAMKELEKNGVKDPRIVSLTDKDFDIMMKIQREKEMRLDTEPGKINNSDIDKWEQTATKRYSLFRGDATDEKGGLKIRVVSYNDE